MCVCDLKERTSECADVVIGEEEVLNKFKRVNANKATGPDKIKGKVLKECCYQLTPIFTFLFNCSLQSHAIPSVWKTAEVVPVPKKSAISSFNDLRPVALTSIAFKCFEKVVLSHILKSTKEHLDPFQFAYKEKRNVEDAVLNNLLKHLETPKAYVRALFIDFSSAFNTIQPHLMIDKLLNLNVNTNIAAWILDFLTARPQFVHINGMLSDTILTHTGAPQGCVLSPILYTIYTNDYRSSGEENVIIKFADDSSILGLIHGAEQTYFDEVNNFVDWCDKNYLKINVSKTKEMIFDFRRSKPAIPPLKIKDETVEVTTTYKYLGLTIDNKISWEDHVSTIIKKVNQRLYFIRKLKSFNVDTQIMETFYIMAIQSVISFGITCYGGNLGKQHEKRLDRVVRKASRIVNSQFSAFIDLYNGNTIKIAEKILKDSNHPLHNEYDISERSRRLISKTARTSRYLNSFIPTSTRLLQSHNYCPEDVA